MQGIKIVTDYEQGGGQTKWGAVVISSVKIFFFGEQLNENNNFILPSAATKIHAAPAYAAPTVNNNVSHVTASASIIDTPVPAAEEKANNNPAPISAATRWS